MRSLHCMWQPHPTTLLKVLRGCFEARESRCFHDASIGPGASLKLMIIGSHKARARLAALLFDEASLSLSFFFFASS